MNEPIVWHITYYGAGDMQTQTMAVLAHDSEEAARKALEMPVLGARFITMRPALDEVLVQPPGEASQEPAPHSPEARVTHLRPEVLEFAEWMESRLQAYDGVRGKSWRTAGSVWLLAKLQKNVGELAAEVLASLASPIGRDSAERKTSATRVATRAADVGNYAMFLSNIFEGAANK